MQDPQTPQPYMSSQVNIIEAKIAHCTKWTCLKVRMWGEMIWGKCIRNIMQISRLIKLLRGEEMYHSSVVHHIRLLPAWFSPGDEFADSGATDELGQKCNQMGMSAPDTCHKEKPKLFHKSTQKYYYTSKKIALQFFWYFWAMTGKKQFDISQRDLVINFFTLPIVHICRSVGAVFCIASAASGSSSSRAMNAFCICWKKKMIYGSLLPL